MDGRVFGGTDGGSGWNTFATRRGRSRVPRFCSTFPRLLQTAASSAKDAPSTDPESDILLCFFCQGIETRPIVFSLAAVFRTRIFTHECMMRGFVPDSCDRRTHENKSGAR